MATRDQYLQQPIEARLSRLARTADDLAAAVRGRDDRMLSRRLQTKAWSAKEVVCRLVGLAAKDPVAFGSLGGAPYPLDAERWAEERQYLRNDTAAAVDAFRRRRGEAMGLLRALTHGQWQRGGLVPTGACVSFGELVAGSAAHDDTYLAQLTRALDGRP
jgi:hypothetical protein